MKHTITMKEVQTKIKNGVSTFSKKDNSPRGCSTVSANEVKIGDEIVIDNYFTTIVEDLSDLVADLERCTSENADLRKEIERLRERLNDTRRYKGEFELENIDLKRKSENLSSQNVLLSYEVCDLKRDISRLNVQIAYLKRDNDELEALNNSLNLLNDILQDDNDRIPQLETENEELRTQLHQYQTLFADIQKHTTASLYETLLGIANV